MSLDGGGRGGEEGKGEREGRREWGRKQSFTSTLSSVEETILEFLNAYGKLSDKQTQCVA